jgi:hypothetical protein
MTTIINIGDDPNQGADDTVTLDVPSGATVNVAVQGQTVTYWSQANPDDTASSGTISSGSNANFTVPSFLQAPGVTTLSITGGNY